MTDAVQPWAGLTRTVDAQAELMSIPEARAHLRVDHTSEDEYIASLVAAARWAVEDRTSRATTNQTWVLQLDAFPDGAEIRLPRPPLLSVSSITYVDANGDTQTWGSSNYVVDTTALPGRVRLAYGASWPTARVQPNAIGITYVAGYGSAADYVPAPMIHAAKLLVGDLYALREGSIVGTIHAVNPAVDALLAPFVVRFF